MFGSDHDLHHFFSQGTCDLFVKLLLCDEVQSCQSVAVQIGCRTKVSQNGRVANDAILDL